MQSTIISFNVVVDSSRTRLFHLEYLQFMLWFFILTFSIVTVLTSSHWIEGLIIIGGAIRCNDRSCGCCCDMAKSSTMVEVLLFWLEKSIKSSSSKIQIFPSSCLYRNGLEDVVQECFVPCNRCVADLDRIHRRTNAIPALREARNPPALTSLSIVSRSTARSSFSKRRG